MIGNRIRVFALSTAFAIICLAPPASAAPFDGTLEHARRDDQRPLRKNPDWAWNKSWPNFFYWWTFRSIPHSVGRSCFRFRTSPDECSGWPAQRQWDRTV